MPDCNCRGGDGPQLSTGIFFLDLPSLWMFIVALVVWFDVFRRILCHQCCVVGGCSGLMLGCPGYGRLFWWILCHCLLGWMLCRHDDVWVDALLPLMLCWSGGGCCATSGWSRRMLCRLSSTLEVALSTWSCCSVDALSPFCASSLLSPGSLGDGVPKFCRFSS